MIWSTTSAVKTLPGEPDDAALDHVHGLRSEPGADVAQRAQQGQEQRRERQRLPERGLRGVREDVVVPRLAQRPPHHPADAPARRAAGGQLGVFGSGVAVIALQDGPPGAGGPARRVPTRRSMPSRYPGRRPSPGAASPGPRWPAAPAGLDPGAVVSPGRCVPVPGPADPLSPRPSARCGPGSAVRWPATSPPRRRTSSPSRRRAQARRRSRCGSPPSCWPTGRSTPLTVVTPTEHLKHQWSAAAAQAGIALDPDFRNSTGGTSSDYTGIAVTYAGVAAHPLLHRARTENRRTLVVLDEVHHAGDARSWGDAVKEAFDPAARRLTLTGTPFRSDDNPIPFVDYVPDAEGPLRSRADHAYGYAEALADGVVRPVVFLAYSGLSSWRTSAGEEITARLGEPMTAEQTARAWRTALDPGGEWIPAVLAAADKRLTGHRAGGMPDAGGLVIATDQTTARAYAAILAEVTGTAPVLVLSDEPGASARIARFADVARPLDGRGPDGERGRRRAPARRRASTPPARPPRCSSRRPSAGSCGHGGRGRRRRCSCPASRCCSGWPASWRPSATTCWASRTAPRSSGTTRSWPRPTGSRTSRGRTRSPSPRSARTPSSTS